MRRKSKILHNATPNGQHDLVIKVQGVEHDRNPSVLRRYQIFPVRRCIARRQTHVSGNYSLVMESKRSPPQISRSQRIRFVQTCVSAPVKQCSPAPRLFLNSWEYVKAFPFRRSFASRSKARSAWVLVLVASYGDGHLCRITHGIMMALASPLATHTGQDPRPATIAGANTVTPRRLDHSRGEVVLKA